MSKHFDKLIGELESLKVAFQPPPPQPQTDPATGMLVDPQTGMLIDPQTGMLIDPQTGGMIDPQTGQPVDMGQGGAPMPAQPGMAPQPGMPPEAGGMPAQPGMAPQPGMPPEAGGMPPQPGMAPEAGAPEGAVPTGDIEQALQQIVEMVEEVGGGVEALAQRAEAQEQATAALQAELADVQEGMEALVTEMASAGR